MKLTIELVPESCWYSNVRSEVSKEEWDYLRKDCYKKANYCCEICGGKGDKWPVECHEIWNYDDKKKIQKLERLIALCPNCHKVKHIGLTTMNGELDLAIRHLMIVNKISEKEANSIIKKSFSIWKKRNQFDWSLDISYLDKLF